MDTVCALYYTDVVRPVDGPSRGHSRVESRHASSDYEPLRSPACTAHSRSVRSSSLLGYAGSHCSISRSTNIYTTTRLRWSHSLLYLSDSYPVEICLYFGWGEKLELEVSYIIFCLVLALSTAYLFCIGFV